MGGEAIPYSNAPDADATQTPDQQAAAGQPYGGGPSPASLLSAIGGLGGAVPQTALMGLNGGGGMIPPGALMSLLQGPSMGMGYAQALAGGVAAMRNQPNPVSAIMDQQQATQMGIADMLMKMNAEARKEQHDQAVMLGHTADREQRNALATRQALETINKELIGSKNPEAVFRGWQGQAKIAEGLGQPIDPQVLQSLSRGNLAKDTLKNAALAAGVMATDPDTKQPVPALTDADIVQMYRGEGLTLAHMPFVRKMAQNDDMRTSMGLPREEDMDLKRQDAERKIAMEKLALIKDERQQEIENRRAAHEQFRETMQDKQFNQVMTAQANLERHRGVTEQQADSRLDLMRQSLERKVDTKEQRRKETIAALEDALNKMDWRSQNLDKQGFLPKTEASALGGILTGDLSAAKAKANQTMFGTNNDDWRAWKQLNAAVIGLDRTVLQDIGPRAKQFFDAQMELFSNPPTLSAIKASVDQFRSFLDKAKTGTLPEVETVYIKYPQQIVNGLPRRQQMLWRRDTPFPGIPVDAIIEKVE